MHKKEKPL